MTSFQTHRQRGQSMVEVLVITLVLGLLVAGVSGSFLVAQRTATEIENRVENTGEAQKLVSAISQDVRTATPLSPGDTPFLEAKTHRIVFLGRLDSAKLPNKIALLVDTTDPKAPVLKEFVWNPTIPTADTPTYAGNSSTTPPTGWNNLRLIGQYVANTSGDAIFKYYDSAGVALVPHVTNGLSLTDQKKVYTIGIQLSVRKATSLSLKPVRVETLVRLPNVIHGNLTAS